MMVTPLPLVEKALEQKIPSVVSIMVAPLLKMR
jgi:hypothetical protein